MEHQTWDTGMYHPSHTHSNRLINRAINTLLVVPIRFPNSAIKKPRVK